ncbi:MAG: redoxin domain-containing protein [Pirellulaceae bacterium]|nr:redoxin domain-containing protein [Pirellulaceae bacterium]
MRPDLLTTLRATLRATLLLLTCGAAFEVGLAAAAERKKTPPESSIGKQVANFALSDQRGRNWTLEQFADKKVVVVAFLGVDCPLVKLYAARLEELSQEFAEGGVAFLGVSSNQQDSLAELDHFVRQNKIAFPMLKDVGNRIADRLGAERTPEIFVLDQQRKVQYHGRVDDQYTYGIQRPKVRRQHLKLAIESLLAGEPVELAETQTVGCHIGRILKPTGDESVTYYKHIAPILQDNCVSCHRSGEVAPFELIEYDEIVGWAGMIAEVVEQRRMPPWHANPKYGHFSNESTLSTDEKELIYAWVEAGGPAGDVADAPQPRTFADGWQIGKPDLVVKMSSKPFRVPANGTVKYQYFVVDPGFKEDKWVKAAECRPGNRAVVHHIIVAARSSGGRGGVHGAPDSHWISATAPGAPPMRLPPGMAKRIPAGSKLLFQMHYTTNGTEQNDLSSVGLVFADPAEVKHEVSTQAASKRRIRIPPHAANHREDASYRFERDSLLLGLFPHMHLRGKSFRYTLVYPDNRRRILLDIPAYDFNWQNGYRLAEPKMIPAGSKLECVAHYDNSENNPANPDPTKTIRWGDQTWDEMMIGYFDMCWVEEVSAVSRTDQFLESIAKQQAADWKSLRRSALAAPESDDAMKKFSESIRRVFPQVDRVDWSIVEDDKLRILRIAQPKSERSQLAGKVSVGAAGMALAEYGRGAEIVAHADLGKQRHGDLRFMARRYRSSAHVPLRIGEQTGVLSFWSREGKAFPTAAVDMLERLR